MSKNMLSKAQRKPLRNKKNPHIPNNYLYNKKKESKFYTKMKIYSYKIDLTRTPPDEFIYLAKKYYYDDLIYSKYFEIGELFSLNKNSSYKEITKINFLFDELNKNEIGSPRVIFFQSPPMIGMSYIGRYFNDKNFEFFMWKNTYGNDNKKHYTKFFEKSKLNKNDNNDESIHQQYIVLKEIIEGNIINKNNKPFFIIFKNLPYDLFLMSLKNNAYTANFLKNWKPTLIKLFELIFTILTSQKYSNIKLIFFTDDKEIDEFELKTVFPTKIIEHNLTKIIILI